MYRASEVPTEHLINYVKSLTTDQINYIASVKNLRKELQILSSSSDRDSVFKLTILKGLWGEEIDKPLSPKVLRRNAISSKSLRSTEDDGEGDSALHWAARYNFVPLIERLLNESSDGLSLLSNVDTSKRTPLTWAIKNKSQEAALALLRAGADPRINDHEAVFEAIKYKELSLVLSACLEQITPESLNLHGTKLMERAIMLNNKEAINILANNQVKLTEEHLRLAILEAMPGGEGGIGILRDVLEVAKVSAQFKDLLVVDNPLFGEKIMGLLTEFLNKADTGDSETLEQQPDTPLLAIEESSG